MGGNLLNLEFLNQFELLELLGDELWEVLGGLNEGERVVTTGNMLIDAQAQLNASAGQGAVGHQHGAPAGSDSTNTTPALPPLTEAQQAGVKEFLALAGAITTALAADDLKEFTTHAAKTHTAVPALAAPFPPDSPWRSLVAGIQTAGHVASAGDLKTARKNFHPLSQAVVEFTKALRQRESEFKSLKIFRCPMTKDAFPGAPRTAEWIQFATPIRNPYFGAEMLDCGSEVKP